MLSWISNVTLANYYLTDHPKDAKGIFNLIYAFKRIWIGLYN
jgi:hypothetical protein